MDQFIPYLGNDDVIEGFCGKEYRLVNGIGSIVGSRRREEAFGWYKKKGFTFETLVHHTAVLARDVVLSEGTQIMAGAIIQAGASIGTNAIINTRASVDHDGRIGNHVHVAPGAILCGNVTVGDSAYVGAGSTIIQGIRLSDNCIVAAGAVVIRDVASSQKVYGVPAREGQR